MGSNYFLMTKIILLTNKKRFSLTKVLFTNKNNLITYYQTIQNYSIFIHYQRYYILKEFYLLEAAIRIFLLITLLLITKNKSIKLGFCKTLSDK